MIARSRRTGDTTTLRPATRRSWARPAAIAIAIGLLGATGCGREPGSGASGQESARAALRAQTTYTSAPARGPIGGVTWNLVNGEPASLDPTKSYSDSNNTVLANLCEGLVRQKPDFSLGPALAASWKQPDPKTWVYTLRRDVRFWDGSPLTAADVAYSLSRNIDPKAGSFWATPFYSNVASITATGPHQVTVRLTRPDALFNRMMATAAGGISKQAYVRAKGNAYGNSGGGLMCTGPFSLRSWDPGSQIVLARNDRYWDPALKPKASSITFKFITDESAIVSALSTGDLDGTFQVPTAAIAQLRSSGAGTVSFGASTEFFGFRQTERRGVLADVRIRRALSLSLDRAAIANVTFAGSGVPAVTPIQPAAWGYGKQVFRKAADALPKPEYDPAQAKRLVRQAGSPKGKIVIAVQAGQRTATQTTETLQSAAREIGLNVDVKPLPPTAFTNLYFDQKARAPYDAFAVSEYGAGVAEPIVALSEFTPLSDYNYGNLDDPAVTGPIRRAMATMDDDRRAALVARAQAALIDQVGVIPVLNLLATTFQSKRIAGATSSLAYLYYPWAARIGAS